MKTSGLIWIRCRHAHQLLSTRMDRPLAMSERIRLWVHLRICEFCSHVARQMSFMRDAVRRIGK